MDAWGRGDGGKGNAMDLGWNGIEGKGKGMQGNGNVGVGS